MLIKKLKTFLELNITQLLFLPLVWILLGITRVIILLVPFKIIFRIFLKPRHKVYYPHKISLAISIGKSVAIMAKYTPWESKCLAQGLVTRFLFRIFSIPSIFYIGVNYDKENKFISHAWVNLNDITVVGGADSFNSFRIIQQFEDK